MKSQEAIRCYYERRYVKNRGRRRGDLKRVHSNLRGMDIKKGDKILDVGCGTGTTCAYLTEQGAVSVGIDIAFEAVRAASQLRGSAVFIQANAEFLPFVGKSFDGVTFMGTLEHFLDPTKALREVMRILKPGGRLCFLVPNSEFFLFKYFGGTGQFYEEPRTFKGWRQIFEMEEIEVVKVYKDIGPSIFVRNLRGLLRGLLRKIVLFMFNWLPICYTYQFVFICRKG